MTPPAIPDDRLETGPEDDAGPDTGHDTRTGSPADEAVAPATVVDLTTGSAHITPVLVDGEARYALDLPDQPLDEDDVASLAAALQVSHSGPAVLVDLEEYSEADGSPEDVPDYQV